MTQAQILSRRGRVAEMHARGDTLRSIAQHFNVGVPTIKADLASIGVESVPERRTMRDQRILEMQEAGFAVKEITAATGITPGVIHVFLRKHGLKCKRAINPSRGRTEKEVLAMLNRAPDWQRLSLGEIGTQIGLSDERVRQLIHSYPRLLAMHRDGREAQRVAIMEKVRNCTSLGEVQSILGGTVSSAEAYQTSDFPRYSGNGGPHVVDPRAPRGRLSRADIETMILRGDSIPFSMVNDAFA